MNGDRTRNRARTLGAAAALLGMATLAQASEDDCGYDAREVFARSQDKVVELFAIGVKPLRVAGRIAPRTGTAFMLDDGYLVTNFHVIADAPSIVILNNGRAHEVEIIGTDPALDIAVLRPWPEIKGHEGLKFASPDSIETGENVFVVGFPMGVGKSISAGIISATGRVLPTTTSSWLAPMIQTDAAISGGNSGGPLLDNCGRVIGMISSAISGNNTENLGFAISIDVLVREVQLLIRDGTVARPWHGIYGKMTDANILYLIGVPEPEWDDVNGFLIETVEFGSDAFNAGLLGGGWPVIVGGSEYLIGGDVILSVDGRRIDSMDAATSAVRGLKIGQTVEIEYWRDGFRGSTSVTLTERPILVEDVNLYRGTRARQP